MLNDVANFTRKRSRKLVENCADLQGRDNMYALSKIIPNMLDTDLQVCGWWGGRTCVGRGRTPFIFWNAATPLTYGKEAEQENYPPSMFDLVLILLRRIGKRQLRQAPQSFFREYM